MRVVVYGAGGVGGTIGSRLHLAGAEVVLIARGAHLEALRSDGMHFITPEAEHRLEIPVASGPDAVKWRDDDVVLMTMKSQHMVPALDDLAAHAPRRLPIVCGQNGVANERMALRRFARVYGMLINLPAGHLVPGQVINYAAGVGGILDTGRYPHGSDSLAVSLTALLTDAGFSAIPDERIMRKKYAKLLMNLGNLVQAATVTAEGGLAGGADEEEAHREFMRRLRREALGCFEAAGIDCASREEVQARHENTYRMAEVPGFPRPGGSSWQSFSRGTGNVETDFLNGEISLLGGLHGLPTPANRLCQTIAAKMVRDHMPVGSFRPSELLEMLDGGEGGEE